MEDMFDRILDWLWKCQGTSSFHLVGNRSFINKKIEEKSTGKQAAS